MEALHQFFAGTMNPLLAIAVALILGLLSTRVMKIVGLPNVTGYLIIGLIIGPYALGLISEDVNNSLSVVSTVALGFIGFSIGVEFKISHIKQIGKSAITITFCQALMATLCVDVLLICLHFLMPDWMTIYEAIILGAIATATAPAATLMVVRQYKAKGIVTGTLLPVVALDDAVGLVVFAISNSIALSLASGSEVTVLSIAVWPLVEVVASLGIGTLIGFLLSIIPRFFKSRDNRLIASIVAVLLSLGISQLFSWLKETYSFPFGLSDLLVCMMAGATFINMRSEAGQVMESVDRWTPVVLMLFFILSGAELNLGMFAEGWSVIVCLAVYVVARCVGKYTGTVIGASITKADPNVKKYLGITLWPQAGVAIGMATMCKNEFEKAAQAAADPAVQETLAHVGEMIVTITMCAVLIYELFGPILTKWALTRAGEIDKENLRSHRRKAVQAAGGATLPEQPAEQPTTTEKEDK